MPTFAILRNSSADFCVLSTLSVVLLILLPSLSGRAFSKSYTQLSWSSSPAKINDRICCCSLCDLLWKVLENLPGKMASVDAGGQAGQKVQAGVASAAGAGQGSQVLQPANWQISPFCNPQLPDVAGVWDGRGRRTLQNCFRIAVEKGTQPSRESFL